MVSCRWSSRTDQYTETCIIIIDIKPKRFWFAISGPMIPFLYLAWLLIYYMSKVSQAYSQWKCIGPQFLCFSGKIEVIAFLKIALPYEVGCWRLYVLLASVCFHASVCQYVRVLWDYYVSAISPVSVDGLSPDFCHWCILGYELVRFWGQVSKVKVMFSRWRPPALRIRQWWPQTMMATNNDHDGHNRDGQLGEIYPTMLNGLKCSFGIGFSC